MGEALKILTVILATIALLSYIGYRFYKDLQFARWAEDMGRKWEDDGNTED